MTSYTFGPVPSRRLGRSLGVDLVPMKTCSFNCVYCQLGRTNEPTVERAEFMPASDVLAEIRSRLTEGASPDFITLSGGGEPTLYRDIGEIIAGIKEITRIPVAVLTNGSLFRDAAVRRDCLGADAIMPSLDAGDQETFERINRPHESITLAGLVEGLVRLRSEFTGKMWLEVFLIEGINATEEHCRRIASLIEGIGPDRVDLNTAVRPTTEFGIRRVPKARMNELRAVFGPKARVVADYAKVAKHVSGDVTPESVFATLDRRPCTLEDICAGLNAHAAEVSKVLGILMNDGRVVKGEQDGKAYYRPAT